MTAEEEAEDATRRPDSTPPTDPSNPPADPSSASRYGASSSACVA